VNKDNLASLDQTLAKRHYTAEQIISKLREVEVKVSQGIKVAEAVRGIGVSEQTYYRWRNEYDLATLGQTPVE
jgi:putative transposase